MTGTAILIQRQALAVKRAGELTEALDPLSETLRLATNEPYPADAYILAEVACTLAETCLQQREHIAELAGRVEALEARLSEEGAAEEK